MNELMEEPEVMSVNDDELEACQETTVVGLLVSI